jgi:hypothetical protein
MITIFLSLFSLLLSLEVSVPISPSEDLAGHA